MKKLTGILGCFALSTALLSAAPLAVPAMTAPKLDGILTDGEWNQALTQKLVPIQKGKAMTQPTLCYIGCDQENLYLAFRCSEVQVDKMRRIHNHIEERDSGIYEDDCIEILVDTSGNDKAGVYHFAVNSCGLIYDAFNFDTAYQSKLQVACKVEQDFWVVEAKLPFSDLGLAPHGAEVFRMNLGRERHVEPAEYSCLVSGNGGFHERTHYLAFRPMPPEAAEAPVTLLGFGNFTAPQVRLANSSNKDAKSYQVKVETLDAAMQPLNTYTVTTKARGAESILKYEISEKTPVAALRFEVAPSGGKEVLYSSTYTFNKSATVKKYLAMKIENPLYETLLGTEIPKQRGFHGFQWLFGAGRAGFMQMFALQNALPYSVYDIGREHKDTGMAIYANVTMIEWLRQEVYTSEFHTAMAIMPRVLQENLKSPLPFQLIVLPEQRAQFLNDVKTIASNKDVQILTMCDENSEYIEMMLIEEFAKHPDNADLQALDAKIKQNYGQGKYGIPTSIEESNPLAWIAYRRALNDELVALYREAVALARSIHPEILIVSDDPIGAQNRLYTFSDRRGLFDITTHQLYPRNNPNIDSFGFLTRYIADLTGDEIWPCPHIEEYGASFTPEEVLYKLSACVRNGATGFHFFLDDTSGKRSEKRYLIHERWGAPDRYAVELGAQKLLAKMPRLKFPPRDAAVFTASDSLRAIPGLMLRRQADYDLFLHGYLGYGAGVSYRFINELTMQNLEQYKFIVTAESEYLPKAAFEALQSYVRQGGTLLIVNTRALSFTPGGESLAEVRRKFTGVTVNGDSREAKSFSYAGETVEVSGLNNVKLSLEAKTKVLANFANGDPALVEKKFGKGRVITLATNPCSSYLSGNKSWQGFFRNFAKKCNAKVDCDIWRFQLPASLLPVTVEKPGICITNNAVRWEHFNPVKINSCNLTGSYTLSPAPDYAKDCTDGEISFESGKLTDRPRAVMAGSVCMNKSSWSDWAIGWKKNQPITVKAKWSEARPVTAVKLMVSDTWGDAKIEIGGKTFDFPCPADFNKDTLSVREFSMVLPQAVKASELAIHIAPVPGTLIIAEMEIWGE